LGGLFKALALKRFTYKIIQTTSSEEEEEEEQDTTSLKRFFSKATSQKKKKEKTLFVLFPFGFRFIILSQLKKNKRNTPSKKINLRRLLVD
jgi:hypothetical protein